MTEQDDLRPWDRRPEETSKAYHAFVTYRDLGGERTIRETCEKLGKSTGVVDRWAQLHNWRSRVTAWDSMPGRKIEAAYEDMAADIAAQHKRVADKLMARLEQNLDLMAPGTDPSIKWSTAHGAARQGHAFASDLSKPKDTARDAIASTIEKLIHQLAGEE